MQVTQIVSLVNSATNEALGTTDILNEDLSNVVDVGTEIFNQNAVDQYTKSLVNHIGKVIFVNRSYNGAVPSVLMDGWEFGSVLEKVNAKIPVAVENDSWKLENGKSYDQYVFNAPQVSAKFFNKRVTFEIDMSYTERQVKQSFSSAEQLNAFLSMLFNNVEKSMTIKLDELVMRTINNMTAETAAAEYGEAAFNTKSGVKAVNLLYEYNQQNSTTLTAAEAMKTPDFLKYCAYKIGMVQSRLHRMSTLFNVGATEKFTPPEKLHTVFLSEFYSAANVYLSANTYHNGLVKLPEADIVAYWQGSGKDYSFTNTSQINVTTSGGKAVNLTGIIGVMFDRDALGVANLDRRVTTAYSAKGEFYNNFYKTDVGYFNDLNENFVVFFVA